jgi:hypothetical protein
MVGDLNMTRFFPLLAVTAALTGAAAPAGSASVHAGEWETLVNGGHRKLICQHHDLTFDQPTVTKMFQGKGLKCAIDSFNASGAQISVHETCTTVAGTAAGDTVMTIASEDAYTSRTKGHMISGLPLPNIDITQTARRLGDCKPGDVQSPY